MKHYGDITKLSGYELPVVDVITGGSPCQDLSVAGKRAGLAGERSGLFMEQIRIVKEMRERDRNSGRSGVSVRPRYMVWENVPGAFSSNGGKDFQSVLEEICKIEQPDAFVPEPPNGKWSKSGCIVGDGFSVAWRVHDAQFWGVPQRRKRIALVADFGGRSAPEILFERQGLSWDSDEGAAQKEETAGGAGESAERSDLRTADKPSGSQGQAAAAGPSAVSDGERYIQPTARALTARNDGSPCVDRGPEIVIQTEIMPFDTTQITSKQNGSRPDYGDPCHPLAAQAHPPAIVEAMSFQERAGKPGGGKGILVQHERVGALSTLNNQYVAAFSGGQGEKAGGIGYQEEVAPSLKSVMSGGNTVPTIVTYDARGNGDGETVCTITGDHESRVTDYTALCVDNGRLHNMSMDEIANTLDTMHDQQAVMIAAVDCRNGTENAEVNGTLQAKESGGNSLNLNNVRRQGALVRRLTPLECERLQGFPDGWTDIGEWIDTKGKKHKPADSPRYKALGNSIALPFWQYLARRICAQYERDITIASLFDGIGGFPFVFERCGAKAVWASEIEEFPIAVTKRHFPEDNQC